MSEGTEMRAGILQEFRLPTGQGVPDIWQEILTYLTDPTDFHNLLLASPDYFEPLLEDRRSVLLFPLALKVLDRRDYVAMSTTLECRLLSKYTKSSVDNWIRDGNPCFENLDGWDHDRSDPKHDDLHCWKPSVIPGWLDDFEDVNAVYNQFLGGCWAVNVETILNEEPQSLQRFRSLLAHLGNQISYFNFHANRSFDQSFELLGEFLKQMPNLRTLEISDFTEAGEGKSQHLLASGLPNLRDLSTLKTHFICSIHLVSIVVERYGTQLKKMCIRSVRRPNFERLPLAFVSNLKHESLPMILKTDQVMEYLNPTRQWLTTLETISVSVHADPFEPVIAELLVALENLFGTSRKLRNLNIYLMGRSDRNRFIASPAPFFLPSLKRLWIDCGGCCFLSIDFILAMRETLEEFTLHICVYGTFNDQQNSQFNKLVDSIYDSNLWDQMAKLERITIRRNTFLSSDEVQVYSHGGPQKLRTVANQRKD